MKACMFLCFHVNFKHKSTKTCMFHVNLMPTFTPNIMVSIACEHLFSQALLISLCVGRYWQVTGNNGCISPLLAGVISLVRTQPLTRN